MWKISLRLEVGENKDYTCVVVCKIKWKWFNLQEGTYFDWIKIN